MKSAAALGCGALPAPSCFNLQPYPHQICISPAARLVSGLRASSWRQRLQPWAGGASSNQSARTNATRGHAGGRGRSTVSKNASAANQFGERDTNRILNDIRKTKRWGQADGMEQTERLKDLGHDTQELPSYGLLQPGPPLKPTDSGPKRRSVLNIRAAQPPQQQFI